MVSCPWIDCKRRGQPQYDAGLGLPRYASKRAQLLLLKLESTLYCSEFRFQCRAFFKDVNFWMSHASSGIVQYHHGMFVKAKWASTIGMDCIAQDEIVYDWSYLQDSSQNSPGIVLFKLYWSIIQSISVSYSKLIV